VAKVESYLPGMKNIAAVLSQWVLTLRSIAWIHAEMIRDSGTPESAHRDLLQKAIEKAVTRASERFWIFGLPIEPPELNLGILLPMILQATRGGPVRLAVVTSAVILLLFLAYFRYRYQAAAIGYLGRCLAEEMLNNIAQFERGIERG
jgi:hypothetical protein